MLKKFKNKKGLNYFTGWAEIWAFVMIAVGFILAISIRSAVINYIVIFACGLLAGRLIFETKKKGMFPYFLIVVGLLLGYMLGSYYVSKKWVVFLFAVGGITSYFFHKKGLVK